MKPKEFLAGYFPFDRSSSAMEQNERENKSWTIGAGWKEWKMLYFENKIGTGRELS